MLSTPPAFILSQDQTLRKEKMHTPSGKRRSSEFELTKEILIADYPLPTPKCRTLIQRNLIQPKLNRGYLAFDKCTLLSSQGSDAPAVRPLSLPLQGNLSILSLPVSLVKSTFLTGVRRDNAHHTKLDRLLSVSASSQPAGQLTYLILSRPAYQVDCL